MEKKCFVIMPFSKTKEIHDERYWNTVYAEIKKILEAQGYKCERSQVGPYKLFKNIVNQIADSDLVVAVLTDFNANVWYELGIRHTLKTGTIMLLEEGQRLPFDVNDYGVIFYQDGVYLANTLTTGIKQYIEKLDSECDDSPVLSVMNMRETEGLKSEIGDLKKMIKQLIGEQTGSSYGKRKSLENVAEKKRSYDALCNEIPAALRGESAFSAALLQKVLKGTEEQIKANTEELYELEAKLHNAQQLRQEIEISQREYCGLPWVFENGTLEERKMLLSIMVQRIEIRRDYELNIQLAPGFDQFLEGLMELR